MHRLDRERGIDTGGPDEVERPRLDIEDPAELRVGAAHRLEAPGQPEFPLRPVEAEPQLAGQLDVHPLRGVEAPDPEVLLEGERDVDAQIVEERAPGPPGGAHRHGRRVHHIHEEGVREIDGHRLLHELLEKELALVEARLAPDERLPERAPERELSADRRREVPPVNRLEPLEPEPEVEAGIGRLGEVHASRDRGEPPASQLALHLDAPVLPHQEVHPDPARPESERGDPERSTLEHDLTAGLGPAGASPDAHPGR